MIENTRASYSKGTRMLKVLTASSLAILMGTLVHGTVSAQTGDTPPYGTWTVESVREAPVGDDIQITMDLAKDGTVSGSGGCNFYSGQAEVGEKTLEINPPAVTRMACPSPVMEQEQAFFDALDAVQGWQVRKENLVLLDREDRAALSLGPRRISEDITISVPGADSVESSVAAYRCGDRTVGVEYINAGPVSLALLSIDKEFVVASNVIAADGAKYAGGRYIWWSKGGAEASLTDLMKGEDGQSVSCTATSSSN